MALYKCYAFTFYLYTQKHRILGNPTAASARNNLRIFYFFITQPYIRFKNLHENTYND